MKRITLPLLLILLISGTPSYAAFIVNTGPGDNISNSGWALLSNQWWAAEFSIIDAYEVTDIFGWMGEGNSAPSTGHISIYQGGADTPTGDRLYSAQFEVSETPNPNWYGLSALSWQLSAGTYWVAFEVLTEDTLYGYMPINTPNPLLNEAVGSYSGWTSFDTADIGIQIQGTPVPLPTTILLLGTGLVSIAGLKKRLKQMLS